MSSSQKDGVGVEEEGKEDALEEWEESWEGKEDSSVGTAKAVTLKHSCSAITIHIYHSDSLYVPPLLCAELSWSPEHQPESIGTSGAEKREAWWSVL